MKRWRKWLGRLVLTLCLLAAVLLAGQRYVLPWFVHRQIVAALDGLGLTGSDLAVRDVAFNGTELTDIRLGSPKHLHVGRVRVDYSLGTLIHGAVTDVTIDAMELPLTLRGRKFDLGPLGQAKTNAKPGAAKLAILPFNRVDLHRGALVLDWDGRRLVLPVEGTLINAGGTVAQLDLRAQIAEVEFQIIGRYDLASGDYDAGVKTASDMDLATLAGLLPEGILKLPGRIDGQVAPGCGNQA